MTRISNFRVKLKYEDRIVYDAKAEDLDSLINGLKRLKIKYG